MPQPRKRSRRSSEEGLRSLGHRIEATGTTRPGANEVGLASLGEEMNGPPTSGIGRHGSAPRSRRRRIYRRGVLIGLVALLVIVAGGGGYIYYDTHDLNRIEVQGLHGALTTGKEAGTENILVVGLHFTLRSGQAERGLWVVFTRCERGEQRRDDDPPRQSSRSPTRTPLDPPRPVHPQCPDHRCQQDRCWALPGFDPAGRSHPGGLRNSHSARRLAQLRSVRRSGRRPGWGKHVLPRLSLRLGRFASPIWNRKLRLERPGSYLRPPERDSSAPSGKSSAPSLQDSNQLFQSVLLAPRASE